MQCLRREVNVQTVQDEYRVNLVCADACQSFLRLIINIYFTLCISCGMHKDAGQENKETFKTNEKHP